MGAQGSERPECMTTHKHTARGVPRPGRRPSRTRLVPPPVLTGHAASPPPRTKRTRRDPPPVLTGRAASLAPETTAGEQRHDSRPRGHAGAALQARPPPSFVLIGHAASLTPY